MKKMHKCTVTKCRNFWANKKVQTICSEFKKCSGKIKPAKISGDFQIFPCYMWENLVEKIPIMLYIGCKMKSMLKCPLPKFRHFCGNKNLHRMFHNFLYFQGKKNLEKNCVNFRYFHKIMCKMWSQIHP